MEPSDAVYKCEPSGNQSATRGHHATVLGKGVAQQDNKGESKGLSLSLCLGRRAHIRPASERAAFALHRVKALNWLENV